MPQIRRAGHGTVSAERHVAPGRLTVDAARAGLWRSAPRVERRDACGSRRARADMGARAERSGRIAGTGT